MCIIKVVKHVSSLKKCFGEEKGECHRFPPQFAVVECGYSTSKYHRFPKVNKYDWCGEWSDKIN